MGSQRKQNLRNLGLDSTEREPTPPTHPMGSGHLLSEQTNKQKKQTDRYNCFLSPERISLYRRKQVKQTPESHCHEAAFLTLFTWKQNRSPTAKLVGKVMLAGQERQPASSPAQ